jgi:hypothetical protein
MELSAGEMRLKYPPPPPLFFIAVQHVGGRSCQRSYTKEGDGRVQAAGRSYTSRSERRLGWSEGGGNVNGSRA